MLKSFYLWYLSFLNLSNDLIQIDLSHCYRVTDAGVQWVVGSCHSPALLNLDLSNTSLTGNCFLRRLPHLRTLKLDCCSSLTGKMFIINFNIYIIQKDIVLYWIEYLILIGYIFHSFQELGYLVLQHHARSLKYYHLQKINNYKTLILKMVSRQGLKA